MKDYLKNVKDVPKVSDMKWMISNLLHNNNQFTILRLVERGPHHYQLRFKSIDNLNFINIQFYFVTKYDAV